MDNYRMKSIKYRRINLLGILLIIGIGCFSCYTKAGSTSDFDDFFNKVDEDSNPKTINRAEWSKEKNPEDFDKIDKNKDGFITKEELKEVVNEAKYDLDAWFSKIDQDGNPKTINRAEWSKEKNPEDFDTIDKNKDGFITKEELKSIMK